MARFCYLIGIIIKILLEFDSLFSQKIRELFYGRKKAYTSKTYELTHIVDRVGSGDAFAGGLIYGLLQLSPKEAIEFAMAAGALKHSVPGDILYCSLQEIQELVAGEGNGKIKR